MPEDKKITIVEVKTDGTQTESVEAPKAKVKAAALGLSPEDVERAIKEKQKR